MLQSFDFANYGANDTIQLRSLNGDVLHAISFVGSGNEEISSIAANWSLVAGNTYNLISVDPNNSKWTYYTFPVSNAHLQVNGGVGYGSNELEPYWFHFTNLATAPVPEPESYAMMVVGLGLLGMMARRRRQEL